MRQANSFSRLNENHFVRVFINLPFICLDEACKWKNESEIEFSHIIPHNKRLCVNTNSIKLEADDGAYYTRWWIWSGSSFHFVYELYLYVSINIYLIKKTYYSMLQSGPEPNPLYYCSVAFDVLIEKLPPIKWKF